MRLRRRYIEGPPKGYTRVKEVQSIEELVFRPFDSDTNCFWLHRDLGLDFNPLAQKIAEYREANRPGHIKIPPFYIYELALGSNSGNNIEALEGVCPEESACLSQLYSDVAELQEMGRLPLDKASAVRVLMDDDMAFHVDGGVRTSVKEGAKTVGETLSGRILGCYSGVATDALRNEDAQRLGSSHYYKKKRLVRPFRFPLGTLWRHATDSEQNGVLPFIHGRMKRTEGNGKFGVPTLLLVE